MTDSCTVETLPLSNWAPASSTASEAQSTKGLAVKRHTSSLAAGYAPAIKMEADLCTSCQRFDLYSFERDCEGFRGYRFDKISEGAAQGCRFCALLQQCFERFADPHGNIKEAAGTGLGLNRKLWIHLSLHKQAATDDRDGARQVRSPLRVIEIEAQRGTSSAYKRSSHTDIWDGNGYPHIRLHAAADSDSAAAQGGDVQGRYSSDYRLPAQYMEFLRRRIEECLGHAACCETLSGLPMPHARNAQLPSRCIKLRDGGIYLAATKGLTGAYITLSHRWNDETETCKTVTSNLEDRAQGKWDCELPQIFKDVFEVAKHLNVTYVWIDFLCIVQQGDGGRDWRAEALQMADYYQRSLITIMATSGTREIGLFPDTATSLPPAQLARLPYRTQDGQVDGHFFVYNHSLTGPAQFESSVNASDLLSRGWVFQEYRLSRRMVFFTPFGMFFECQLNRSLNDRQENTKLKDRDNNHWYGEYLSPYSGLSLTKGSEDRLVALAGVMKEAVELLNKNYRIRPEYTAAPSHPPPSQDDIRAWWACGFWQSYILYSILWHQETGSTSPRTRLSRYPTWSWASRMMAVTWKGVAEGDEEMLENAKILKANGEALSTDPELGVTIGAPSDEPPILRATGQIVPILVRSYFGSSHDLEAICNLTASAEAGGLTKKPPRTREWRQVCMPERPTVAAGWGSLEHPDLKDDAAFVGGSVIYALPVFSSKSSLPAPSVGNFHFKGMIYTVLFVRAVVGGERYERVGMGRLFGVEAQRAFSLAVKRTIVLV